MARTNPDYNVIGGAVYSDAQAVTAMGAEDPSNPLNHARYTDVEAVAAMGAKGNLNPLNHDRYTDVEAVSAMGAKDPSNPLNHDRYTDVEAGAAAVAAMGPKGNANPLNHDRYTDVEAVAAMGAKDPSNPLNHDRYTDGEAQVVADARIALHDAALAPHAGVLAPLAHTHAASAVTRGASDVDADLTAVEGVAAAAMPKSGGAFSGVVTALDPVGPTEVATRQWVLSVAVGVSWQTAVLEGQHDPPVAPPPDGTRFIALAPATGVWAGHDNEIPTYHTGTGLYTFEVPSAGWFVPDITGGGFYAYDGSSWIEFEITSVHNDLSGRSTAGAHPAGAIERGASTVDADLTAVEGVASGAAADASQALLDAAAAQSDADQALLDAAAAQGTANAAMPKAGGDFAGSVLLAGLRANPTDVSSATYTLQATDVILGVTRSLSGACAITLPTALLLAKAIFCVKDAGYNCSAVDRWITITPEGLAGEKVNNDSSAIMNSSGMSAWFYSDGANWHVF